MPPPFQDLDLVEFDRLLGRFPFERRMTAIHLHHTWRPALKEWRGYPTLRTIWYTHTLHRGWSDIAQHLTIAPDGTLWTGRDWNRPPCSSRGMNGSRKEGPFMIALVGNFNAGGDELAGVQRERTLDVIVRLQDFFGLSPEGLGFHRDLDLPAHLDCPGKTIDCQAFRAAVAEHRVMAPKAKTRANGSLFSEDAEAWYQFITISSALRGMLTDEAPDVPPLPSETIINEDSGSARSPK